MKNRLSSYSHNKVFIETGRPRHSLKRSLSHLAYGVGGLILLFILWWVVGTLVFTGPRFGQFRDFMPLPALKALSRLFTDSLFWEAAGASLRRVGIGLLLAFIIGFSWGIFLGLWGRLRKVVNLPMQLIRMISPLSWMPIAILLLPTFEQAIYFLILMASVWQVMHNTMQGIKDVDPSWIDMARIQGANHWQLLTKVLLPSALPYILNGLRLALGIAWIILVPAEYLGINNGLGYLINDARDTMEYDRLMGLVIAIGILGFLLDSLFHLLSRHFDYREKRKT